MKYGYCKNHSAIWAVNSRGLCDICTKEKHERSAASKGRVAKSSRKSVAKMEQNVTEWQRRNQSFVSTEKKRVIRHRSDANKELIRKELEMFNEIWNERDRKCRICEKVLTVFNPILFHHIRTKGAKPELRLEKSNIALLCDSCHIGEHGFRPKLDREGNLK
jgi:hypothetical protein